MGRSKWVKDVKGGSPLDNVHVRLSGPQRVWLAKKSKEYEMTLGDVVRMYIDEAMEEDHENGAKHSK